jgi:eukaryotic-like serine/threonine-protein kinase
MTPERWQQVKDLLGQALQIPPEERGAFLDGVCNSDQELRAEIVSLLSEQEVVQSKFLQSPPLVKDTGNNGDESREPDGALRAGLIFAERFELVRKLGEGGMGQVWLVEQTSPVRRQVALKLIKAGMYDESVVKRFQAERQSLAIMDHPAIAKVFDAGTTPQGQPYFVMEYVPGLPITEYCDQKKFKIADRLELFIQACEGVQHAHQKAIIHRDLKPANILVVEIDGKPVPRIIDFGLAKAVAPQAGETLFTQMGHLVGTPGYMSPEQADTNVKDIDTRTDVYSLGAVLYVLLAGSQPFDAETGEKLPLDELLRKLREEEPPSPSTRVSGDRDTSSARAEARGTVPKELANLLHGDLDWITMKALDKDRNRRYGTPSELAADLRRYLNHEAVSARPASTGYRLRKYVRRHRVTVTVAAALVMLLAAFSIVEALQLRRITRERDRANRERDRATRITDFMTNIFKVSDPSEARGKSVTAREILDKASNDMGKGLARDPVVKAQMMQVLATIYWNLGLFDRAHELAQQALDVRSKVLGPNDPDTLRSMVQLASILARQGDFPEAEKFERDALARERRVVGAGDPLTLRTTDNLAVILGLENHGDEKLQLEREAVEVGTRELGAENPEVVRITGNLGSALSDVGRYAEAEQIFRRVFESARRVEGPDAPHTLIDEANIGFALRSQGHYAEAEPYYREVLAIQQKVLGIEHRDTTWTMDSLTILLVKEGRLAEAENMSRRVFALRTKSLGPEHFETLEAKAVMSDVLSREGHTQQAEKLQRDTLATLIRVVGPENTNTLATQSFLARTLNSLGRYSEAEKLARETYAIQLRTQGLRDSNTAETLQQLGEALAYRGRYDEAAKLFQEAIAKSADPSGQGDPFRLWYAFACVAAAANRSNESIQYLQEAVKRGYKSADAMAADDDLKDLRGNARFQQLVVALKSTKPGKLKVTVPGPGCQFIEIRNNDAEALQGASRAVQGHSNRSEHNPST